MKHEIPTLWKKTWIFKVKNYSHYSLLSNVARYMFFDFEQNHKRDCLTEK